MAVSKRHIVISAVNVRKGGTLTVLKDCLCYLSSRKDVSVTAIVHRKSLCAYDGIEYIEIPWSADSWIKRLWCEYVTLGRVSKKLPKADLWFSLHDTTPRVRAEKQAVYCHTSFPFMKSSLQDLKMDYKIALFSKLTRFAYKFNVRRNSYLVVQQQWMREALGKLLAFNPDKIIVAPPSFSFPEIGVSSGGCEKIFLYPSTPDCHKDFETLCRASAMLEQKVGKGKFRTVLTISGNENKYASWLYGQFKDIFSIEFRGFLKKEDLLLCYEKADCLVFPSRSETWGLPISEFKSTGKPMILADLPYAHETSAGARKVAFFSLSDSEDLQKKMHKVLNGEIETFSEIPRLDYKKPVAEDWDTLFRILLES